LKILLFDQKEIRKKLRYVGVIADCPHSLALGYLLSSQLPCTNNSILLSGKELRI
jgi:hypothetical protein